MSNVNVNDVLVSGNPENPVYQIVRKISFTDYYCSQMTGDSIKQFEKRLRRDPFIISCDVSRKYIDTSIVSGEISVRSLDDLNNDVVSAITQGCLLK